MQSGREEVLRQIFQILPAHWRPVISLDERTALNVAQQPSQQGTLKTAFIPRLHLRGPLLAVLACAALACPLWHLHIMNRWMSGRSDLMAPYIGARTALAGHDPYSQSTTEEIQRKFYGRVFLPNEPGDKQAFAYPLYTAYVIAPLALLPWELSRIVFVVFAIPLLCVTVICWLRILGIHLSAGGTAACAFFTLTSWPMMVALRHQQLTLVAFVLLTGGCFSLSRGKNTIAGVFLGFAAIKPQLVVILIFWLCLRAFSRRQWRFPAALFGTSCLLFFCSEWKQYGWVHEWISAMANYRHYTNSRPSLVLLFGEWPGVLLFAPIIALSCFTLWRLRRCDDNSRQFGVAAGLALGLSVALCPTTIAYVYNQALLLPGCLFLVFAGTASRRAVTAGRLALCYLALSFLAVPLSVIGETLTRPLSGWDYLPYANFLLPAFITVALALAATSLESDSSMRFTFRSRYQPIPAFSGTELLTDSANGD